MKHPASLLVLALITLTELHSQPPENTNIVKLKDLEQVINSPSDKVKVINFWATWCAPCIKEIPLFERLNAQRPDVEVTLVNMDLDLDPDPEKVYAFVNRKGMASRILILNENDPNSWIDKIDPGWSGALPATLIVNPTTGKRVFVEKEMHDGELEKLIGALQ
jgi:thiol-disulfide isomerase/thioredoxin